MNIKHILRTVVPIYLEKRGKCIEIYKWEYQGDDAVVYTEDGWVWQGLGHIEWQRGKLTLLLWRVHNKPFVLSI